MDSKTIQAEQLIERLYAQAKLTSPALFQTWAMEEASKVVAFDSGIWGDGVDATRIHSLFLYKQTSEMVDNYGKLLMSGLADELTIHIINNLGTAVAQQDFYSYWHSTEWYQRHCKQFAMEHSCAMAFYKPKLQLFTSVAYYRADPDQPFTEEDKRLKEIIDPHLRESYELCLLFNLYKDNNDIANSWEQQSIALTDDEGYIYYCNENFIQYLQTSDIARNAVIHPNLWKEFKNQRQLSIDQTHISLTRIENNQWLISLQPIDNTRQLTDTEQLIAENLATGMSYKEIARERNRSVSTIKNQAYGIYKKLNISGKDELVHFLKTSPQD